MVEPFAGRLQFPQHRSSRSQPGLGQPGEEGPLAAPARRNEGIERIEDDQAPGSHPLALLRRWSCLIVGNPKPDRQIIAKNYESGLGETRREQARRTELTLS